MHYVTHAVTHAFFQAIQPGLLTYSRDGCVISEQGRRLLAAAWHIVIVIHLFIKRYHPQIGISRDSPGSMSHLR